MKGRPPIDVHKLEPKVLAVMKLNEEKGMTLKETGDALGISESTVKRIKNRPIYHDVATDILEEQHGGLEKYLAKLDSLTEFKRKKFVGTDSNGMPVYDEIPDGNIQTKNVHKICDIFGVEPPREHNVQHTLASLSNEALFNEIERTEQELGMDGEGREPPSDVDPSEKK